MEFIQTALDTTIDGHYVDLTILLTDKDGQIPEHEMPEHFQSGRENEENDGVGKESPEGEEDREKGQQEVEEKKLGKALYRKIAQSDFEVCS